MDFHMLPWMATRKRIIVKVPCQPLTESTGGPSAYSRGSGLDSKRCHWTPRLFARCKVIILKAIVRDYCVAYTRPLSTTNVDSVIVLNYRHPMSLSVVRPFAISYEHRVQKVTVGNRCLARVFITSLTLNDYSKLCIASEFLPPVLFIDRPVGESRAPPSSGTIVRFHHTSHVSIDQPLQICYLWRSIVPSVST